MSHSEHHLPQGPIVQRSGLETFNLATGVRLPVGLLPNRTGQAVKPTKQRELLFSVTKKDLDIETFKAGGKGGQNQNTRDTGVRIRHRDSGAVGESREHRTQGQNRKAAFIRMTQSDKFLSWWRIETARRTMKADERKGEEARYLKRALNPSNLLVEVGQDGEWVPENG